LPPAGADEQRPYQSNRRAVSREIGGTGPPDAFSFWENRSSRPKVSLQPWQATGEGTGRSTHDLFLPRPFFPSPESRLTARTILLCHGIPTVVKTQPQTSSGRPHPGKRRGEAIRASDRAARRSRE